MERRKFNLIAVKVAEDIDESLALQIISDPNLDIKELSEIIEDSLMNTFQIKATKEPYNLSKKVMMAGFLNIIDQQIEKYKNNEHKS